jgi:HEAT repeat protein
VERLKQVARDERASMPLRWRAITALGEIAGASERRTFEELMRSRHWYVRNAALVAMRQSDTARAAHWSRQMLADPALLVRSAAVQSLADVTGPDVNTSTAALWKELDQAENFRGQQSLFIRPQIVASLGRLESSQATGRFVKLLDDRDPKVVAEAKRALSRMHRDSRARSTQDWKRWWQTASERTQSESSRTR